MKEFWTQQISEIPWAQGIVFQILKGQKKIWFHARLAIQNKIWVRNFLVNQMYGPKYQRV